MKRPAAAPTRPSRLWPALFALSLAANLVLAWFLGSRAKAPPPAAPAVSAPSLAAPTVSEPPRELQAYAALGSFVADNNRIPDLKWNEAQFAAFVSGLRAAYEGRGLPLDDEARKLRDDINTRVQAITASTRADPLEDYFKTLREKESVQRTASGLHYRITEESDAPHPDGTAIVLISYAARLPSGEKLPGLTRARTRVPVRDLLPGLAEGVRLLGKGGKALIYVPPALSFGEGEWPADVPRGAPIVFFLELHDVVTP